MGITPKEPEDKDRIIDNNYIKKCNMKNKNGKLELKTTKNFSYIRKRGILNKNIRNRFNSIKPLNTNISNTKKYDNENKPCIKIDNIKYKTNINNNIFFSNINNYITENKNYKNILYSGNNIFNTNCVTSTSCSSANNIFIKKNPPLQNNYLSNTYYNQERNIHCIYNK